MKRTNVLKQKEINHLKALIEEKTGYRFSGDNLLIQAFTRSSYAAEAGIESNEILEFIGDQVLSYYTIKLISEHFGAYNNQMNYRFRIREKQLSEIKNKLISNENLASIIDSWNVIEYLIVGKSDYLNHVDEQVKVKADLFEAILGAIAVRSEWDSNVLEKAVIKMLSLNEILEQLDFERFRPVVFTIDNAVNTLKELAERGKCTMPEYSYSTPEHLGYDKDGNPIWTCRCSLTDDKTGYIRTVFANSKKDAKKTSAYLVLCQMFELQNEHGVNRICPVWHYKDSKLYPDIQKYDEYHIKPKGN